MGVPTLTWTGDAAAYNDITVTFTPNNHGGNATCTLAVSGGGSASVGCGTQPVTLQVGGLWPNNTYGYRISVTNAAGSVGEDRTRPTNQLRFTVICTQGVCNPGPYAYRSPSQTGTAVNDLLNGETYIPECYIGDAGGRTINAQPWGGKQSNLWLRLQYNGTAYFPWAFAVLDGGDNLGLIPPC